MYQNSRVLYKEKIPAKTPPQPSRWFVNRRGVLHAWLEVMKGTPWAQEGGFSTAHWEQWPNTGWTKMQTSDNNKAEYQDLLAWMFPLTTFISWYLLLRLLSGKGFYNLLSADWHRSDWVRNAFLKLTCSCCSGGRIQAQVLGFLTLNQVFFSCGTASVLPDTACWLTGG